METYRSRVVEYESTVNLQYIVRYFLEKANSMMFQNARLKQQLAELQMRLDAEKRQYESSLTYTESRIKEIMTENRSLQEKLKALYETNQTLYAEIAIYRKLLDGEEGRFTTVQQLVKTEQPLGNFQQTLHLI